MNSMEVRRIVARTYKTEKTENISEGSLKNKAYNFDTATVESMRDTMIQMLNTVNGYKNNL